MKAPDRIYVPTRFELVDELRVRESDTDEEYIRKDALLELLREKRTAITECSATNDRKVAAISVIDFLIDDLTK